MHNHKDLSVKKIAIIGCGASGIIVADVLLKSDFIVTIFEQREDIGGVWKYKPGSVMYNSLRTNLPKEIMAFNQDFPIHPISDQSLSSFVRHEDIQKYLEDYVDINNLKKHIKFSTQVTNVKKKIETKFDGCWEIYYQNADSNVPKESSLNLGNIATSNIEDNRNQYLKSEIFDAVVVCNGHFSVPFQPDCSGFKENYNGESYHSRQYDEIKPLLKDKIILIVGSNSSGTDMARELCQDPNQAAAIFISDRNCSVAYNHSSDCLITVLPAIACFVAPSSVYFINGESIHDVECVLWCTGYLYEYPFLDTCYCRELLKGSTARSVRPLYEQLLAIEDPSLAFVGLPFSIVPFPLFYFQALYLASVYSGKATLPTIDQQYDWLATFESNVRIAGQESDRRYHYLGPAQWGYLRRLGTLAGALSQGTEPDDGAADCPVAPERRRLGRYLSIVQAIYEDCLRHRAATLQAVNGVDSYRERWYRVDWDRGTWEAGPV